MTFECRSKYTVDEIGLVPEKQFREEAPQRFQDGIEDEHKLQLQRLEYEKHSRLELVSPPLAFSFNLMHTLNTTPNKSSQSLSKLP